MKIGSIPHIEQYFQPWSMYEPAFTGAWQTFNTIDLAAHVAAVAALQAATPDAKRPGGAYALIDGVAVIGVVGTLTKYGSSLMDGPDTVGLRKAVRFAASDREARAIMLLIDSPGGSTMGISDLAADIAAANRIKPVHAYIEDTGASAAYWLASQAGRVSANAGALIGGIGSYTVVYDSSKKFERDGVRAIVIKAGEFKGVGAPGVEITEDHAAEIRRTVEAINSLFVSGVGSGRRMEAGAVLARADGRVHLAAAALDLMLIDAVETFDEAMAAAVAAGQRQTNSTRTVPALAAITKEILNMSEANEKVTQEAVPATVGELIRALPDSDAQFREDCMVKGLTLTQARTAWMDNLRAKLQNREEEIKTLKSAAARPGVPPLGRGKVSAGSAPGGDATDPIQALNDLVAERVATGVPRHKAFAAVCRENPDLHHAYVQAKNPDKDVPFRNVNLRIA